MKSKKGFDRTAGAHGNQSGKLPNRTGMLRIEPTRNLVRRRLISASRAAASRSGDRDAAARSATRYPASSIAFRKLPGSATEGRYETVARSAAKFTLALTTPGVFRRAFSIRCTQEAQLLPR